ncbi:MAG TPA: serine/threonine-protein kinase, partial [Pirellulaceae bacterium]
MTAENPSNDPLVALAESFAERYRRGERVTVDEFAEQHPEFAERIREIFPALIVMEDLASPSSEPADLDDVLDAAEPPRRIGDYRIVREIGRGGMGVVFEAEQVSLGRAVALKILTRRLSLDARALERFRAEARSAGRLHHPRIVPVHDVGRAEDFYYYTMQLISGHGLDVVLSEIQRARGNSGSGVGPGTSKVPVRSHDTVQALARTMYVARDSVPSGGEGGSTNATRDGVPNYDSAESLFGKLDARHYHRRVAHIGQQVAESLYYAHSQGVLHRDIKPSNLLLDAEGNIWVTDFGLAKAVDSATASDGYGASGARLTDTGDVVGTVRYMAPERFRGWSDPRSDVYALGITLYELLTLRPAFEESDRLMLIQNIRDIEPPRPRTHDAHIPLDLETIVLKAIHKEPSRRYQTAGELAGDLRNFLEYRPIAARRTTRAGRVAQWARRNRALAAALAGVAGLLVTVAVGASLLSWRLNRALDTSKTLLRQSLLDQARSARSSSLPGGRTLALDALRKAAAIQPGLDLRNEAIAAMTRTDIQSHPDWSLPLTRTAVVFGRKLEYSLADDGNGLAFVRDAIGRKLQRIPVGRLWVALASPDYRFLIVKDGVNRAGSGPERLRVFEWRSGRQILQLDGGGDFDFHPHGTEFVVANNPIAGHVEFYDLPHGHK